MLANRRKFNKKVANIRVRVEHCIGILKARFQSLKSLRLKIKNKKDLHRCIYWIRVCCVLHNFLLLDPVEEEWMINVNEPSDVTEPSANEQLTSVNELGQIKREQIMEIVLFE